MAVHVILAWAVDLFEHVLEVERTVLFHTVVVRPCEGDLSVAVRLDTDALIGPVPPLISEGPNVVERLPRINPFLRKLEHRLLAACVPLAWNRADINDSSCP